MSSIAVQNADSHHEIVDVTTTRRPRVLLVVANPRTSTTTGWPVGFWAAELTHPYYQFTRARYDVTVASPDGGRVESTRCRTRATSRSGRPTT
jgi:putative intracellular protease/amidase